MRWTVSVLEARVTTTAVMRASSYYYALPAALLLAAAVAPAQAWPYGRTIPPLPAAWRSTVAADMATAYFVGNSSGLDSAAELAAEARWGIIGIGWQLNGSWAPDRGNRFGRHVEVAERETAAALKARNPKLKVLLGRNTEVATCYLDSVAAIWNRTDVWLKCPNRTDPAAPASDCVSGWGSWGQKKFFDFSQPALQAWYADTYGNFDIILDNLSGISGLLATPTHAVDRAGDRALRTAYSRTLNVLV